MKTNEKKMTNYNDRKKMGTKYKKDKMMSEEESDPEENESDNVKKQHSQEKRMEKKKKKNNSNINNMANLNENESDIEEDEDDVLKELLEKKKKGKNYRNVDGTIEKDAETLEDARRKEKYNDTQLYSDPSEVGSKALHMYADKDKINSLILTANEHVQRTVKIQAERMFNTQLTDPLNIWETKSVFVTKRELKIVDEIPRAISIVSVTSYDQRERIKNNLPLNKLIADSMVAFSSGTKEVKFKIDTLHTNGECKYDPEELFPSDFQFNKYNIMFDGNKQVGDDEKVTFESLLSLIFRFKKLGDVIIRGVKTEVYIDDSQRDRGILNVIKGKKLPVMNIPHVFFSTYKHELKWYADDIREVLPIESVKFGRINSKFDNAGVRYVEYYAVVIDNYLADLIELHQLKLDSQMFSAKEYVNALNYYSQPGVEVKLLTDERLMTHRNFYPNKVNADQYLFCFLISPTIRTKVYSNLEKLIISMKGIQVESLTKIKNDIMTSLTVPGVTLSLDTLFIGPASKFTVTHFYQMMIANKCHAFIHADGVFPITPKNFLEAIVALLYILIDALLFPSFFWTNIHIYSSVLYRCYQHIDLNVYCRMLTTGFTRSFSTVRELTRVDILNGETPFAFSKTHLMPALVRDYIKLLAPLGYHVVDLNDSEWNTNVSDQRRTYVPFTKIDAYSNNILPDTPMYNRIERFKLYTDPLLKSASKRNSTTDIVPTQTASGVQGIIGRVLEMSRGFGVTCHYELWSLYLALSNGPEIPYETYDGKREVNSANIIGIGSDVNGNTRPVPSTDRIKVFPGVGLYGLLVIQGDSINKMTQSSDSTTYAIYNPIERISNHFNLMYSCEQLGEAFGIMSLILKVQENKESPWEIFLNMFGKSLKTGVAKQVLSKLLEQSNIDEITQRVLDEDTINSIDFRLNNPILCDIDIYGNRVTNTRHTDERFKNRLELLSNFERLKLEISLELISGVNSPLHRFVYGFTIRRQMFTYLRTENRHTYADEVLHYDSQLFNVINVDGKSYISFNYKGHVFAKMSDVGFPENIGVTITNPGLVLTNEWNYLSKLVENKGWMLIFPNQGMHAKVLKVPSAVNSETISWEQIYELKVGSIFYHTFIDSTDENVNYKTTISEAGYTQYICALDSTERNVLVRWIDGLYRNDRYASIDRQSWVFGDCKPQELGRTENGTLKYKTGKVNFNNIVRVYSDNVMFNEYPRTEVVVHTTERL